MRTSACARVMRQTGTCVNAHRSLMFSRVYVRTCPVRPHTDTEVGVYV